MPEGEVRRLIQRRPHGQRNAAQRQQRPGITDNSDLTPGLRWALGISLCVLFISMGLVFYVGDLVEMKKYALNFYDYQEDESIQTPGRILQKLVEDSDRLITVERSLLAMADIQALVALVRRKYQPVQDRVTSLTTLVGKYEKMERSVNIRPEQFISSALDELTELEDRIWNSDDKEMQEILSQDAAVAVQLLEDYKSMIEQGYFILDVLDDPNLAEENITIAPTPEVDSIDGGKYIDNLILKHGFDEVITVVRNLAPVYEERDGLMDQIVKIKDEMGIEDINGVFYYKQPGWDMEGEKKFEYFKSQVQRYETLMDYAVDYVIANGTIIQLLLPHHSILQNRVADLVENYYTNDAKKRKGYLNLRNELLTDISNLQIRIRKL